MCRSIAESATVPESCDLGCNVVIEDDVMIGERTAIGHGSVICQGSIIGSDVTIAQNVVIGKRPASGAASRRKVKDVGPFQIGDGSTVGACAVLYAGSVIGKKVMVADLATIREGCDVADESVVGRCVSVECNTSIGRRVRIQTAAHITGDMIIEDEVFVGPGACFMNDRKIFGTNKQHVGPTLKKGCAIGSNASIMAGVTVGEGALVGAGSVVTKDVAPGEVYVGVAARPLKKVGE